MSDNLPPMNDPASNPQGASNQPPAAPIPPQAPAPQSKGLAITALVLGIVGVIFALIPLLNWIGIILGAVAVILGIIGAVKKQPKGLAITGIILGALAIIIGVIMLIVFVAAVATLGGGALDAVEACANGATSVTIAGQEVLCSDVN